MPSFLPGEWYRVKFRMDPGLVAKARAQGEAGQAILMSEVKQRAEARGLAVRTCYADPLSPDVAVVLGQWSLARADLPPGPDLTFLEAVSVEPPPPLPAPLVGSPYDREIPSDEAHAVEWALQHESDPQHLRHFGGTLLPDFPVAASLLLAKARGAKPVADPPPEETFAFALDALAPLTREKGQPYVSDLVRDCWASLLSGSEKAIAQASSPPALAAALTLSTLPSGIGIVTKEATERLTVPAKKVSGSAIALVELARRDPRAKARASEIEKAAKEGREDGQRALRELHRAASLVRRRRWVLAYQRKEAAENEVSGCKG